MVADYSYASCWVVPLLLWCRDVCCNVLRYNYSICPLRLLLFLLLLLLLYPSFSLSSSSSSFIRLPTEKKSQLAKDLQHCKTCQIPLDRSSGRTNQNYTQIWYQTACDEFFSKGGGGTHHRQYNTTKYNNTVLILKNQHFNEFFSLKMFGRVKTTTAKNKKQKQLGYCFLLSWIFWYKVPYRI